MTAMAPLPKDAPVMVAWEAYKASEDYVNTRQWATQLAHTDGSLWAAFYAGHASAIVDQSPKGQDPQGLGAKHASDGAKQSPETHITPSGMAEQVEAAAWLYERTNSNDGNLPFQKRRWVQDVMLMKPDDSVPWIRNVCPLYAALPKSSDKTTLPDDGLRAAATKARDKFLHYEDSHRLKCTSEGDEKADRNREMADMLTAALQHEGGAGDAVRQFRIGEPVKVLADNLPEQWRADWFESGTFYIARIEASGDSVNYTISDSWPIKRSFSGASCLTDGFGPDQLAALSASSGDDTVGGEG